MQLIHGTSHVQVAQLDPITKRNLKTTNKMKIQIFFFQNHSRHDQNK